MAWVSFPSVGAVPGGKPFETFGKDSGLSSEGGSTGRRTDWPCHINIADTVRLLRPSVQLPAGIHGWRGLYGFRAEWQGKAAAAFATAGAFSAIGIGVAVRRSRWGSARSRPPGFHHFQGAGHWRVGSGRRGDLYGFHRQSASRAQAFD